MSTVTRVPLPGVKKILLASAVGAAILSTATHAQQAEQAGPPPSRDEVTAIYVTAQHREENIQNIPVTVTAVSRESLQEQEFRNVSDIANTIPNFHVATVDSGGASRPRFYVRGLGTNDNRGVRSAPFGVYFDGVYVNSPAGQALPLYDVERLEVLRGPQGTLYGKNTLAGAVNLISRSPTFTNEGYFKASLAEYAETTFEGAVSGGLSDTVAARLAFYDNRRDSYVDNLLPGGPSPDGPADTGLRLQFLYAPSNNADVTLQLHGRNLNTDGFGWIAHPGNDPSQRYSHKTQIANLTGGETNTWGGTLTGNFTLNNLGGVRLSSVTAYFDIGDEAKGGNNASLTNFTESQNEMDVWQVSQEFRIASPDTGRLTWITGIHLFKEELKIDSSSGVTRQGGSQTAANTRFSNTRTTQWDESAAVFGSATWEAAERLELTVGLRYTWQEKEVDILGIRSPINTVIERPDWIAYGKETYGGEQYVFHRQKETRTWKDTTWDTNVLYSFTDSLRGYFKFARGFQSGGFNTTVSIDSPPADVDPEFIDNYELGIKSEWLNNRVVANFAAFYYDYKDAQIFTSPQVQPGEQVATSSFLNADKATVYGLEAELRAQFNERWSAWGNLGLLRTEYKEFTRASDEVQEQILGNEFTRSPRETASLGIDYAIPAFGGELKFGADLRYQSLIWFNPINQGGDVHGRKLAQEGYTVGNARVIFKAAGDRYQVSAYVRNITDKAYRIIGIQSNADWGADGTRSYSYHYGAPRVVGASLTVNF